MGENECFFGHNIARGSGGTTGWTQSRTKKLSLGAGFYVTIAWKGFFTQSQVLLSSIVPKAEGCFKLHSHSTGCVRTPGLHIKTKSSRFIHLENTIHSQGINTNGRLRIPLLATESFCLPPPLESIAFLHLGADIIGARWRGLSTLVWFWDFLCLNS